MGHRIHGSPFDYRSFLNALISFVLIALVVFLLVVKPANELMNRMGRTPAEDPVRRCPECLGKVPVLATRCAYCTSTLTPAGSGA